MALVACVFAHAVYGAPPAQAQGVELLLPGNEYVATDVPLNPAGTWWVLHLRRGKSVLERLEVGISPIRRCGGETADDRSGRSVTVQEAHEPILLVRGELALSGGPVRTAFFDTDGSGEAEEVEVRWNDQRLMLRHRTVSPQGDQAGQYHIDLTIGDRDFALHTDQWQGDGHWKVRWIGDLNRDRMPDLLVDASYKYSVHTTRLFLSQEISGHIEFTEVAQFEHTAC